MATTTKLDVGDLASLDGFIRQVRQTLAEKWDLEQLDILVNNAGILRGAMPFSPRHPYPLPVV